MTIKQGYTLLAPWYDAVVIFDKFLNERGWCA